MRSINILSIGMLLMAMSCQEKMAEYKSGQSLGEIVLEASESSVSVSVDYDCIWRVHTPADWISTDVEGRGGSSAFSFSVTSNESDMTESRAVRKAPLVLTRLDKYVSDTLWVIQRGIPDGKDYVTNIKSSSIELQQEPLAVKTILYCNLQGLDASTAEEWIRRRQEDLIAAVWTNEEVASFTCEGRSITRYENLIVVGDVDETLPSNESLIVNVSGLNVQLADFTADESNNRFRQIVSLLDEGYNIPSSSALWLIGGSFYHLSSAEFGYPTTPQWYPSRLKDPAFDADTYAWTNNLIDCVWMTSKTFNPTYTGANGNSWRADYVYASKSAWNSITDVHLMEDKSLMHKPILIKIKY